MSKEAMVEVLSWNLKLDPILPPLLRVFHALPPTSPRLSLPRSRILRLLLIPPSPRRGNSTCFPVRSGTPTHTSPKPSTLDRALSVFAAGCRSFSLSPSPIPPSAGGGKDKGKSSATPDMLLRAHDLLAVAAAHYPNAVDADDALVDALDNDELSPLVALLKSLCAGTPTRARTRVNGCSSTAARELARHAGERVLGLMGSVYRPRLKDFVGGDAAGLSAWTGRQTGAALKGLVHHWKKQVVIMPIAFTSDYIESFYEISLEYAKEAREHGIEVYRAEYLNDSPVFIRAG
ncbi:hypothetical protein B0H11DRAFT_2389633 [Mycena galericulata]|nr:hypothetical protein B0H11DRAFT_2389633 [Mycena galericulata]